MKPVPAGRGSTNGPGAGGVPRRHSQQHCGARGRRERERIGIRLPLPPGVTAAQGLYPSFAGFSGKSSPSLYLFI